MTTATGPERPFDLFAGIATRLRVQALSLPRSVKQLAMVLYDVLIFAIAAGSASWLLYGSALDYQETLLLVGLSVIVAIPTVWAFGIYSSIVRFMGVGLLMIGLRTAATVTLLVGAVGFVSGLIESPLRWGVAFLLVSLTLLIGGRFLARLFLNRRNGNRVPVIIYGAGGAGAQLTGALFGGDEYLPIALVDDDAALHGRRVQGIEVYSPDRLPDLITSRGVKSVLLAIPSASQRTRRRILETLSELSDMAVQIQTMPQLTDIVSGKARIDEVREVEIGDLLGRSRVPPDRKLLSASIEGKRVMVTGAGGSIGSELCRQIIRLEPELLVLYDVSEIGLYSLERELRQACIETDSCEIVALLGSVHHKDRVAEIIDAYSIQTLYHAAAYKHVPIVEHNLIEGIHNNAIGTLLTAQAAIENGVETFVLISTDKAVSPTSVMGATKRLAEMILQALQDETEHTRLCMVRFGNVLGSSGSVVPLFKDQIRAGGPVTVTHPNVIRYFMTIPEAAQLVIQAGAMAEGGEVFVLDMGEPVRIHDLAKRMINLMGLTVRDEQHPNGDIEVVFTGLRPGEKLYEELLIGSDSSRTSHPHILRAREDYIRYGQFEPILGELLHACHEFDRTRAREILHTVVSGYQPPNGIEDHVWARKRITPLELRGKLSLVSN